mgnify:CR=1 FL=1
MFEKIMIYRVNQMDHIWWHKNGALMPTYPGSGEEMKYPILEKSKTANQNLSHKILTSLISANLNEQTPVQCSSETHRGVSSAS